MIGRIRVLDSANRTMQRLGYLKLLCALVNETETSNINSLGNRFIQRIMRREILSYPIDEQIRDYAKYRLTDGVYSELRKNILENEINKSVSMEIQDFYLADKTLPSRTGRLVKANWRKYPYLGTSLELIKKGTYSALTRSLVLLAVTPKEELDAFNKFDSSRNPMKTSDSQKIVFLYCFIDNDSEVIKPLFQKLLELTGSSFNERDGINFLPDIFRQIIRNHHNQSKTIEERDRLALLIKTANSIERWKGKAYTGGGAPQESIRVRLEPYCDLGLFEKQKKDYYEYRTTSILEKYIEQWTKEEDTHVFLHKYFFSTFAIAHGIKVKNANDDEAIKALFLASETLKSSLGYSPIVDVGLLAGVHLLIKKKLILEISKTFDLLKIFQKQDPNFVRFTVDRMGTLAYVKFLKPLSEK